MLLRLLQRPCGIGASGEGELTLGSNPFWSEKLCRSLCVWLYSMSSTTSVVVEAFGRRRRRRIPMAALGFWSVLITPGTKAWTFVCTAPWLCFSFGPSWIRLYCAVFPARFQRMMQPNAPSVGTSPKAEAGLRPIARWPVRRPTIWVPRMRCHLMPPTTPLIKIAISGKTLPATLCCRCGEPSNWLQRGRI